MSHRPTEKIYYAVKEGWFCGIFETQKEWIEAIKGYQGFKYGVFYTKIDAQKFVEIPITIYTDGSKSNKKAGIGVYSDTFTLSLPVQCSDTNMIEFLAVLKALTHLRDTSDPLVASRMCIKIFTDSKTVQQTIENGKMCKVIPRQKIYTYRWLCKYFSRVSLRWIRRGKNTKADTLAKRASGVF